MDEKKILVAFCTRNITEDTERFKRNLTDTAGEEIDIIAIENPSGNGLTSEYNKILELNEAQGRIVLFVHDDIEVLNNGWATTLKRIFKDNPKYGIVGVAGAAEFDEGGAWWQYGLKYGQVLHRSEGKSWLTSFSPYFEHDLEEVCVIDGLFIAIDTERVDTKFDDENFQSQFYDISFCLDNFIEKKTKIGVTTKIRIAHNSVGSLKPEWYTSRNKMIEIYGDYLPIKMKKQTKNNGKRHNKH